MAASKVFGPFSHTIPPVGHPGEELTLSLFGWWSDYAFGYMGAASVLIEQIDERNPQLDKETAVYPILFCYRHYIELMLKQLLLGVNFVLEITPPGQTQPEFYEVFVVPNITHNLSSLWKEVRGKLEKINMSDAKKEYPIIECFIDEFAIHDPRSFSFRYPIDKEGLPTSKDLCNVNLAHLYESMHDLDESFGVVVKNLNWHISDREYKLVGPPDDQFWDADHFPHTESEEAK